MRYNHVVRELYFDAMAKLPWEEVVKPRGASFDSMRNGFLHLTLVEDRWVNHIIPDSFREWVDPNFDDYNTIDDLKSYMLQTKNRTVQFLQKLSPEEANRSIVIPWGNKPYPHMSIENVLTHMVMEDLLHYGELSALLWQMDTEAPYLAFWHYMHNKQQPPQ